MHSYSVDSAERRIVPYYLAVVALAATFAVRAVVQRFGFDAGSIYVPSGFAVYGFLYWAFDRFLWKFGLLHRCGIVRVPDLNGTWSGELRSSHSRLLKPHEVSLRVHQTWSTVLFTLESSTSISRSAMANFIRPSPGEFELRWEYQAEAKPPSSPNNFNHRGVTRLRVPTSGSSVLPDVAGDYYTQHGRDSSGTISLRRTG
jgi:SMODS-associating 2TM, beta-strand rich effector domain